ncbi:hypothetical protein HanXRQr2_Chr14g0660741 [Helianthus annuus]|uniref:Uncharacterized protein n=1 Tax=Helianthus annuus TaxID=4232 RepID=A0A9K3ECV9_HELAN|nr:hypothetical protein HanXRQr2_Chr14g0660741 [Helianthus annuus]KAJ0841754.1 hypothetical protein HanPSC8_Chr14g0633961 [Helianthus annuus]
MQYFHFGSCYWSGWTSSRHYRAWIGTDVGGNSLKGINRLRDQNSELEILVKINGPN